MTAPTATARVAPYDAVMQDLAALEERVGLLIAHAETLAAANESLRRDLAAAELRNQTLSERVSQARRRLDALLARFPEPAE